MQIIKNTNNLQIHEIFQNSSDICNEIFHSVEEIIPFCGQYFEKVCEIAKEPYVNDIISSCTNNVICAKDDLSVLNIDITSKSGKFSKSGYHIRINYSRQWGHYCDLARDNHIVFKIINVNPFSAMSRQLHNQRLEIWLAFNDFALYTSNFKQYNYQIIKKHDIVIIPPNELHQIINPYNTPLIMVEWQISETKCDEDDIFRITSH